MAADSRERLAHGIQSGVSRVLAEAVTLDEAAPRLLATIASPLGADAGELWLVDPLTNVLSILATWHRTASPAPEVTRTLAPGEEAAGRAWATGRPLVTSSETRDATGASFQGSVAVPMSSDAGTIGVLVLYFATRPASPGLLPLDSLTDVGNQCGQFVARRRAEDALRESEERYRSLILSLAVGVAVVDASGAIETANPAAERILGRKGADLVGRSTADLGLLFLREDGSPLPPHESPASVTLREGRACTDVGLGFDHPDGKRRWISVNSEPLTRRGEPKPAAALVSFIDVTERRLLEEQLRQSQKMEALGHLAGSVAHDFNNLLTPIIGYSEALQSRFEPGSPLRDDLEEIRKAGERAASLTRQLLAFSRWQPAALRLLDVNAVVNDLENLLRHVLGAPVELRLRLAPGAGHVRADPSLVEQVLMNLAVNARDAMPRGGTLTVETLNVELEESYTRHHLGVPPGPYVLIAVSDTGTGIDPHVLPRIFEPFFTTKELGRGTGLGLSTVYGIVKQSGGHIGVQTEKGRGTAFKVYLPRVTDHVVPVPVTGPEAHARGVETLLLVEDDEPVRTLAGRLLRERGYTVLEAANGEEALATAAALWSPIHLLVADAVLPGMTAPSLARELKLRMPGLKVLYMSGYTEAAISRTGAVDAPFLQLPFSPGLLADAVRRALDAPFNRPLSGNGAASNGHS